MRPVGAPRRQPAPVIIDRGVAYRPVAEPLAAPVAPLPHEAATASWGRSYDRERREGTSAVRGLAFGLLFSLPVWGLLIAGVVAVVDLLN